MEWASTIFSALGLVISVLVERVNASFYVVETVISIFYLLERVISIVFGEVRVIATASCMCSFRSHVFEVFLTCFLVWSYNYIGGTLAWGEMLILVL